MEQAKVNFIWKKHQNERNIYKGTLTCLDSFLACVVCHVMCAGCYERPVRDSPRETGFTTVC